MLEKGFLKLRFGMSGQLLHKAPRLRCVHYRVKLKDYGKGHSQARICGSFHRFPEGFHRVSCPAAILSRFGGAQMKDHATRIFGKVPIRSLRRFVIFREIEK